MADDTRKASTPPATPQDQAPTVSTLVREARAPANVMPGGTAHTAGGERVGAEGPSYIDVVRNLPADYYLTFYKRPCVRDSQLTGIGAGFVGGSIAAIMRKPVLICSNYAVAAWCAAGCIHYQICQHYRSREKDGMRQARELMEKKRATIEARKEARRKAREEQLRLEEEQRREEARRKTWSYWIDKNVRFW
ncbi:hypothetical protein K458DRAFT_300170 [Lentithecium fluviatile CBS 122367]|uniref:Cytochrome c oxidase assembly protein COX20, mitochondrial n=1 Tax=Lentithecium fluviatile CBS 122367 TaxID=1168545 RepID=A0A6G1J5T4_9PLEO|nr:hypothetical protein K458DRAFT_300170 [Lentithecium fluviatile CBS 122367]